MNWNQIWEALAETLQMTLPSTIISYVIGLPLGVLLVITRRGGIRPMPTFNAVAGAIVNFLPSIPFCSFSPGCFCFFVGDGFFFFCD